MSSRVAKYYIDRQIIGKSAVSKTVAESDAATITDLMATPYRTSERKCKSGNGYRIEMAPNSAAKDELQSSNTYLKKDHATIRKFHEEIQTIRKRKADTRNHDDSSSATKRCKISFRPKFKPQSDQLPDVIIPKASSTKPILQIKLKVVSTSTKAVVPQAVSAKPIVRINSKPAASKITLVTKQARLEEAKAQQALDDCASRLREHARWNDCVTEPSPAYLESKKRKEMDRDEDDDEADDEKWNPYEKYGDFWLQQIAKKGEATTSHTAFWQERNRGCEQPCTPPIVASQLYHRCIQKEAAKPGINPEKTAAISAKIRDALHEKYPRDPQKDATKIFRKARKVAQIASKYVESKIDTASLMRQAEAEIAKAKEEGVSDAELNECIIPISAIPLFVRHLYQRSLPKAGKYIS